MSVAPTSPVISRDRMPLRGQDEWLLTNGLGGFGMGTVSGVPGRRYHAWLVAAMTPPVGRVVALSGCAEWIVVRRNGGGAAGKTGGTDGGVERIDLSTFRFVGADGPAGKGVEHPTGVSRLARFERTPTSCRWIYDVPEAGARVSRELFHFRQENAISVRYVVEFFPSPAPVAGVGAGDIAEAWLEVRPFTPMRDFHGLVTREDDSAYSVSSDDEQSVRVASRSGALLMGLCGDAISSRTGRFSHGREWWKNFLFARDRERGQECVEQWFSPGAFVVPLELAVSGRRATDASMNVIEIRAAMEGAGSVPVRTSDAQAAEETRLAGFAGTLLKKVGTGGKDAGKEAAADRTIAVSLAIAADQFVVRRETHGERPLSSIIAGYPWFSDWGRDAMISLPGLLLAFGRLDEARDVLVAFASMRKRGLIPNCFDNGSGQAQYNTVDASLWFVHACCEYLRAGGDAGVFAKTLRPACLDVIDAYRVGTDYAIKMDERDGLISAGSAQTQLTWMDAQRDGVVFTPRAGKAVEVNALWYSALRGLAAAVERDAPRTARELSQVADVVARHFERAFWNTKTGCLFDLAPTAVAGAGGGGLVMAADADAVRPNQIFAVSLPYSALSRDKQQAVVLAVHRDLMTPVGLRTLGRAHPAYQGQYEGSLVQRDAAYHQGTAWPWLMGAFVEALLRVEGFSPAARARGRELLMPLLRELLGVDAGAAVAMPVGSLCEVYDGDDVIALGRRRPEGCMMQAWSVAEVVRAWGMVGGK